MLFIRTGRARLGSRIRTAEDHRLGGGCSTRSPVDHTGRAYTRVSRDTEKCRPHAKGRGNVP